MMMMMKTVVFALLLSFCHAQVPSGACLASDAESEWKTAIENAQYALEDKLDRAKLWEEGQRLEHTHISGHKLGEDSYGVSEEKCKELCDEDYLCLSINYWARVKRCSLKTTNMANNPRAIHNHGKGLYLDRADTDEEDDYVPGNYDDDYVYPDYEEVDEEVDAEPTLPMPEKLRSLKAGEYTEVNTEEYGCLGFQCYENRNNYYNDNNVLSVISHKKCCVKEFCDPDPTKGMTEPLRCHDHFQEKTESGGKGWACDCLETGKLGSDFGTGYAREFCVDLRMDRSG